jgi:ATP-dependent phosphofructokinase / diphosphate-dependent phosphofructokinase
LAILHVAEYIVYDCSLMKEQNKGTMTVNIGICTGGGDCPGLNAVIRAVTRHAILNYGMEVFGVECSLNGILCSPPAVRKLTMSDVSGILHRGGTILGTSNKGSPFKDPKTGATAIANALTNWKSLGLDCLIVVGGDGTQRMALQLQNAGMPIIGIPKTIDNDYEPTDVSIGFMTAVEVASEAISRLQSTAESHSRVMVAEVMGRDAGFIALHAGLASSANVILLPEIPFSYDAILLAMEKRRERGRNFSIVVVAEGAHEIGKEPKFRSSSTGSVHLGGVADEVAIQIHARAGIDSRVTVLGHIQRGGSPAPLDRILATAFGVHAVDLVARKEFGQVVGYRGGKITNIAYSEFQNQARSLSLKDPFLHAAESVGICLGR